MRAVTYLRVSTDEQAASGLGLEAQRDTLQRALDARCWEHIAEHMDEGRSGSNLNRPALAEALQVLERKQADVLLVARGDRLSRSVADFIALREQARRQGWAIVALDVGVDTSTPAGELIANVMSSVSQWERKVIGERTSLALQAKKAQGARLGAPVSLGQDVRERIVRERAEGQSFQQIADGLTSDGVPTARGGQWHRATVKAVCQSVQCDVEAKQIRAGAFVAQGGQYLAARAGRATVAI